MDEFTGFVIFVISTILIITFFVIAYRLKRIADNTDILKWLELKKPENRKQVKCENCGKEDEIPIYRNHFRCTNCKTHNHL